MSSLCFTMLEVSKNILGGFHMLPQTLVQLQELLTEERYEVVKLLSVFWSVTLL